MWDPPRPGLEPVSPALAGRLSTTAPPGKPHFPILFYLNAEWRSCIWEGNDFITLTEGTAFPTKQQKPSWLRENVPYHIEGATREIPAKCHLTHNDYRITEI